MNTGPSIGLLIYLVILVIVVFEIAALWTVFTKAGRPGWASIIPLYSTYVLIKICGHSGWWLLLLFVPILDVILYVVLMIDLARSFGRGTGFGIGLIFLSFIFIPILAFGGAKYLGPATALNRPALS